MKTFFFFREHPDFGTKIGVFSRLRPANSNNFEKWPTRVQKLDHSGIRQSNYRTGAPQTSGMFHWGSAPPKRLKTTAVDKTLANLLSREILLESSCLVVNFNIDILKGGYLVLSLIMSYQQ